MDGVNVSVVAVVVLLVFLFEDAAGQVSRRDSQGHTGTNANN